MRLSPGRILAAAGARLRGARYAIEDVLYLVGRFLRRAPRAAGRGWREFWRGLALRTRVRLGAALAALAGMIAILALAAPSLPCELPGGGACPPPDDAEALVPAEALAYVHVDLDPDREQLARAGEVAARVPTIVEQLLAPSGDLLPGCYPTLAELVIQLGPWIGDEAATALLAAPGGPEQVWLLAVADPAGASAFAERAIGPADSAEHRGVEVEVGRQGGLAAAQVEGFLVLGPEASVREVLDVATAAEGSAAIAAEPDAQELRDELPAERLADAYLSPAGAARLLGGADDLVGSLRPFVSPEATRGVAIALGAGDGAIELALRSGLDPDRSRARPGLFAAFAPFEPELAGKLSEHALAYFGIGDPEQTVTELLAQAATSAPGIAGGFEGLAGELRRDGELDIEGQLLPALGDEMAFAIEPRSEPGLESADPTPFFELLARGVDPEAAREALARLQRPIADAIEPAIGLQAPFFSEIEVGGVEAQTLSVSPTIALTYALVDDLAVIATDPLGVERVAGEEGDRLDGAEPFERATEGFPKTVSLLVYLDLRGLVSIAERLGLAADPAYASLAAEIRSLHGFGLAVSLDEDLLATDSRLVLGAPEEGELPLPAPEPEAEPVDPEASPDLDLPSELLPGIDPPGGG